MTLHRGVFAPTASRLLSVRWISQAGGELAALHLLGQLRSLRIGGSQKDAVGGGADTSSRLAATCA